MFGYTLIKKSDLRRLEERSDRYHALYQYGYWFSGFPEVYGLLRKFANGEVSLVSIYQIRTEFAESLGCDDYGRKLEVKNDKSE